MKFKERDMFVRAYGDRIEWLKDAELSGRDEDRARRRAQEAMLDAGAAGVGVHNFAGVFRDIALMAFGDAEASLYREADGEKTMAEIRDVQVTYEERVMREYAGLINEFTRRENLSRSERFAYDMLHDAEQRGIDVHSIANVFRNLAFVAHRRAKSTHRQKFIISITPGDETEVHVERWDDPPNGNITSIDHSETTLTPPNPDSVRDAQVADAMDALGEPVVYETDMESTAGGKVLVVDYPTPGFICDDDQPTLPASAFGDATIVLPNGQSEKERDDKIIAGFLEDAERGDSRRQMVAHLVHGANPDMNTPDSRIWAMNNLQRAANFADSYGWSELAAALRRRRDGIRDAD